MGIIIIIIINYFFLGDCYLSYTISPHLCNSVHFFISRQSLLQKIKKNGENGHGYIYIVGRWYNKYNLFFGPFKGGYNL
jgi:hypothetical protein